MEKTIVPVPLQKSYRLLNVGGTTLVSAKFGGESDVMPATWACPLDFDKATVVVDSSHFTRRLIDKSGIFALQLPTAGILRETMALGSVSKNDDAQKIEKSGAEIFYADGFDIPLVKGCAAWLIYKVVSEPHNEKTYDLIIGDCVAAWADERVFRNGHWEFETAPANLRTLHYVAGGHFYTIGEVLRVPGVPDEI